MVHLWNVSLYLSLPIWLLFWEGYRKFLVLSAYDSLGHRDELKLRSDCRWPLMGQEVKLVNLIFIFATIELISCILSFEFWIKHRRTKHMTLSLTTVSIFKTVGVYALEQPCGIWLPRHLWSLRKESGSKTYRPRKWMRLLSSRLILTRQNKICSLLFLLQTLRVWEDLN